MKCYDWIVFLTPLTYLLPIAAKLNECKDKNKYCSYWERNRHCLLSPSYMAAFCPKSCGACSPSTTTKTPDFFSTDDGSGSGHYAFQPTTMSPYPSRNPKVTTRDAPSLSPVAEPIKCGKKVLLGRIVGGKKATPGSWPWQVGIKSCAKCNFSCGGTIIDKEWVITAAHCVVPYRPEELFIEAGVVNQGVDSGFKQVFKCKEIHVHQNYGLDEPYDHDIALLKLDKAAKFNDNVRPLCLNERKLNVKQQCVVTGFGKTAEQGMRSSYLRQASVPIVERTNCAKAYRLSVPPRRVTNNMICAGFARGGIDSCGGDSGGPLTCYDIQKQRFVLGGIISWGVGCARPNQYGVYTNVQRLASWVKNITKIQ